MNAAALSLVAYGIYLLANGALLLVAPNLALSLFGLPATGEPWIRMLGLVAGEIGFYFTFAGWRDLRAFYAATVGARFVAALVFVALVLARLGPWQLLIFGAVDAATALWTYFAARKMHR